MAQETRDIIAHLMWMPVRTGTEQLGGRRSPDTISGHLRRVCNDAVEHVHAIGPTAMARALVAALTRERLGRLGYGQLALDGVIGWGALQQKLNTTPWQHLGDLGALRSHIEAALG